MRAILRSWLRPPGRWLVLAPWIALTLLHYLTPAHHDLHAGHPGHEATGVPWFVLHDLYRRLYYVPILSAALLGGARGGLLAAAAVTAAFLPHVIQRWAELPTQRHDALFEILLYFILGGLLGSFAEALRREREAALRADQLRGAGELAAGMAHEVRNPLAAITGAADRLKRDDLPAPERAELLEIVAAEGRRLDGIVRDFLAYARPGPLARRPARLDEVLRETAALIESTARRRGVRVELGGAAPVPEASMDPARIKQALLNLLLNAVEASPDGGVVELYAAAAGRRVEARIRDHGAGLPAGLVPFTPFATTKPGGTGLGLPVARQILEAHGGTIAFVAAADGGTVAVVSLPAGGA